MMSRCGSHTRPSTRRSTFRDAGLCAVNWWRLCGTGRALRVPRARTRGWGKKFVSPEIMISKRPAEAEDRAVPGHWEGDLILGLESSAIGTLVERTTRFTILLHLPRMEGHGGPRIKNGPALAGHGARSSPTCDRVVDHHPTRPAPPVPNLGPGCGDGPARPAAYRDRPGHLLLRSQSPWQRGTNENTNGLLRQYFPKGTDLAKHSNQRPRSGRRRPQQPPPKDPRLEDPRRSPQRSPTLTRTRQCCDDPLNPGSRRATYVR